MDGDGHLDLAVVSLDKAEVGILLGNGDGSFKPPTFAAADFGAGIGAAGIIAADFNGDSVADLATVKEFGNLTILIGIGGGAFEPPDFYNTFGPASLSAGDVNGDGNVDLVIAASKFPNYGVHLLLGIGNGSFTAPTSLYLAPGADDVDLADVNGDGHLDVVASVHEVRISLGNGDGTFSNGANLSLDPGPSRLAIDDMDGDGDMDVVAANAATGGGYGSTFSLFRGNGDASFESAVSYLAGPNPYYVAVADFDNDGFRDIAGISGDKLYVLVNNDDATFPAPIHHEVGHGYGLDAGDLNGDGFLDLVTTDYVTNGNVIVVFSKGSNGNYSDIVKFSVQVRPRDVALADFNGDGFLDIAAANEFSDSVSILLGNGDGTFQTAINTVGVFKPMDVVVGDWNGDGKPDLAVVSASSDVVNVLIGLGNGSFEAPVTYDTRAPNCQNLVSADFNADGVPDLAFIGPGVVSVMLGAVDGTFQAAQAYAVLGSGRSLVVGDFNGDSFVDLAAANNNSIAIMINAADWPPLPIEDGPPIAGRLALAGVGETAEMLPTQARRRQAVDKPALIPAHGAAIRTAPLLRYLSRAIARVAQHNATDPAFDSFSMNLG